MACIVLKLVVIQYFNINNITKSVVIMSNNQKTH